MQSDSGEFINVIHWASNRIRGSSWSSTRPTTLMGAANLSPYDAAALEGRDNTGVTPLLTGYSFTTRMIVVVVMSWILMNWLRH